MCSPLLARELLPLPASHRDLPVGAMRCACPKGGGSWALVALVPCGAPYGVINVRRSGGPSGRAAVPQGLALEQGGRLAAKHAPVRGKPGREKSGADCLRNESGCRRRRLPCREESVEDFDRACP